MGSTFVSLKEAAATLGVTRRTIDRWIKNGYLRKVRGDGYSAVIEEDVIQLKKSKDDPSPSRISRELVSQLLGRVTVLESQMSTVRKILNLQSDPLHLTDPELRNLYIMARTHLKEGWPPQVEELWADTFLRMSNNDLEKLEKITEDTSAWKPFLLLCTALRRDSDDKTLREQFEAGKSHLFALINVHHQLKGKAPQDIDYYIGTDGSVKRVLRIRQKIRLESAKKVKKRAFR